MLQKFQRFQFVQSTRARFTCQRLDQCFRYRFNTVKIVQAGHGSEGARYRVSLQYGGGGERLKGCRCGYRGLAISFFR
ncbi:hypothetical protein BUPH_08404 (plasmid) [Paraburkholderia phenoliruptrix BR3459a]|uniref:Uncharacterized protein n=1 Tax=Paraburkholderia phenoliruptrix BR3459a TaxID=1229205 RepID=K0E0Y0_9BURK|nr:hypothetical protein BUPH_08404 [Paraburkholderia phenoliruptrix BR3459a]